MLALNPFADAEDLRFDADLVVVDRAKDASHGHIVIAAVNGEPVCKRLHMRAGQLALFPENPMYPKRYIIEGDDFMIWGVVTHSIRDHGVA